MERIHQKIGRVGEYLALLKGMQADCEGRIETDPIFRGALLHYLYLVSDTCIALAEMVIRLRGLRTPQSYYECFETLGAAGILDGAFATEFAKIAGFRNFLAHDYESADAKRICRVALERLPEIEEYIRQIRGALDLT